jgi:hypothetical protein
MGVVPEDDTEVDRERITDSGTSPTGSTTTVTDSGALWDTDQWVGASVSVTQSRRRLLQAHGRQQHRNHDYGDERL